MTAHPLTISMVQWVQAGWKRYVASQWTQLRTRANCIIYGRKLYRRLRRWTSQPGRSHWRVYYSVRRSDWGPFNHRLVMMTNRKTGITHTVSWKPVDPRKRALPPPLFRGRVRWGDA